MEEVETYVTLVQNTVAQFIATILVMDMCLASEQLPGARVSQRWWEQESLDLEVCGWRKGC